MIFHKMKCCLVHDKSQRHKAASLSDGKIWIDSHYLQRKKKKKTLSSFFLPERNSVFFLKKFLPFIPVFHPQRFFPLNKSIKKPKQHNGTKLFKVHWNTYYINLKIFPGIVGGFKSAFCRAVEQVSHATAGAQPANPSLRSCWDNHWSWASY